MQEKSKEYNEKEQQVAENRSRNTLFERRENLQKHESYASERRQYDAIRNGQTDRIQSVFQITPDGTPGILSRNELRNSKNMFIAGITLFTRAAIEGGVPEETAYALSDGYIQTVEECTSKSSIEKLSQKAALRFAQEVQKSGMRHYSKEICFPSGMEEMGPYTKKLRETLTGIQMGEIEGPEGWVHKIM